MTLADTQSAAPQETKSTSLDTKILLTVLVVLAAWAVSIITWGVPGLYIPAVAMVPVCYVMLILISRG